MRLTTTFINAVVCFSTVTLALEWEYDDAYVIEDESYVVKPDPRNEEGTTVTTLEEDGVVVSVEVVPGKCTRFRECYPVLYFSDGNGEQPTITSAALRDFILSTSSPCELSQIPTEGSEKPSEDELYIWCPTRNYMPKPGQNITAGDSTIEEQEITTTPAGVDSNIYTCGPVRKQDLSHKVVGGREAEIAEYPWTVAILNRNKQFCGGSLIDDQYVLTAAHCVSHMKERNLMRLQILIGDHDIKDPEDVKHTQRNVSKVIFHKGFSMRTIHHDIALLKLSEPVVFTDNVVPVCLSDGNPPYDDGKTSADLSGWGQTQERGPQPSKLRTADLKVWTAANCAKVYKGIAPGGITSGMVCAGSKNPKTKDACRGDSGGPLTVIRNNRTEQIGLVSWGIGCGTAPGVYTRVDKYIPWIEKHRSM